MNMCFVCNQKKNTQLKNHLQNFLQGLQRQDIERTNNPTLRLDWSQDINIRCKNGMNCPDLQRYEFDCKMKCNQITPYLQTIVDTQNSGVYHWALTMLQGYFPMVYKQFEMAYNKKKSDTI